MNQALTTRNYDGTFSHWHGGHGGDAAHHPPRAATAPCPSAWCRSMARGARFIRTGSSLACYLPDKRTVLVEQRPAAGAAGRLSRPSTRRPRTSMTSSEVARTRLNRRDTHVITVDAAGRVPLRLPAVDRRLHGDAAEDPAVRCHGQVIEQIVFASLTIASHIPDAAFRPEFSTEGFQWLRDDAPAPAVAPATAIGLPGTPCAAARLSHDGALGADAARLEPQPVDHLVFTDGVASVSVFIERQESRAGPRRCRRPGAGREAATVGSSSAFSTVHRRAQDHGRGGSAAGDRAASSPPRCRPRAPPTRRAAPSPAMTVPLRLHAVVQRARLRAVRADARRA